MRRQSRPRLHVEVLGQRQRRVLAALGPVLGQRGFYLGGGTGVALHLGHRRSVDLDWFTSERVPDALRLAEDLRAEGVALVTREVAPGTIHGRVRGVRVSLLEYRYPLLEAARVVPPLECPLASLDDLATMKLSAAVQRGSRKDFVDLYAIGLKHRPLAELLALYRRRFGVKDVGHVLFGLSFFDNADRERMPRMRWRVAWASVKRAIRAWVRGLAR